MPDASQPHPSDRLTIPAADGEFAAHLVLPSLLDAPAVVLLSSSPAFDDTARSLCRRVAAQGFVALWPDLHWRGTPTLDSDHAVNDTAAALAVGRHLHGRNRRTGVLGIGDGAMLAFRAACCVNAHAAACHGSRGLLPFLDERRSLRAPLLIHADIGDLPALQAAFMDHPDVTLYPCRSADVAASDAGGAWTRSLAFLRRHLS